jgi:hypothetical protein
MTPRAVVARRCVALGVLLGAFLGPVASPRLGLPPDLLFSSVSSTRSMSMLAYETTIAVLVASVFELVAGRFATTPFAAVAISALTGVVAFVSTWASLVGLHMVVALADGFTCFRAAQVALAVARHTLETSGPRPPFLGSVAFFALLSAPAPSLLLGRLREQPLSLQTGTVGFAWFMCWMVFAVSLVELGPISSLSGSEPVIEGVGSVLLGVAVLAVPSIVAGIDAVFRRMLTGADE